MNTDALKKYDYVVMIDKSGSMSRGGCPGNKTRWQHVQEQAENVARICGQFDDDGIDVVVFAGSAKEYHGVTADKVEQVFKENSPGGGTDTAGALKMVLDAYFERKKAGSAKPLIVLCFTDGEPDSQEELSKVIIDATKKIESDEEIGISFLQVGDDSGARAFLKSLDDDLTGKGAKFDIVDTENDLEMEKLSVEDILMKAVTD